MHLETTRGRRPAAALIILALALAPSCGPPRAEPPAAPWPLPSRAYFSPDGLSGSPAPAAEAPWAYALRASASLPDGKGILVAVNRWGAFRAEAVPGGLALEAVPCADFATRTARSIVPLGGAAAFHLYRNKTLDAALGAGSGPDSELLVLGAEGFAPFRGLDSLLEPAGGWQLSGISIAPDGEALAERKKVAGDRVSVERFRVAAAGAALAVAPVAEEEFRAAFAPRPLAELPAGPRELVRSLAGKADAFCLLREAGAPDQAFAAEGKEGDPGTREFEAWKAGDAYYVLDASLQALFACDGRGIRMASVPPSGAGFRYTGLACAEGLVALFLEKGEWPMVEAAGVQFIPAP